MRHACARATPLSGASTRHRPGRCASRPVQLWSPPPLRSPQSASSQAPTRPPPVQPGPLCSRIAAASLFRLERFSPLCSLTTVLHGRATPPIAHRPYRTSFGSIRPRRTARAHRLSAASCSVPSRKIILAASLAPYTQPYPCSGRVCLMPRAAGSHAQPTMYTRTIAAQGHLWQTCVPFPVKEVSI